MRILVTNDDGVDSPGLSALALVASAAGHNVLVAAPKSPSSGAGAGLRYGTEAPTITRRPGVEAGVAEVLAVDAQPGMIAVLAMTGQLGPVPELVLSGINDASNLGSSVLHSGTAAAAMVAAAYRAVGVAVSLYCDDQPDTALRHWEAAQQIVSDVLPHLADSPGGTVYNLNVPNVSRLELPLVQADWRLRGYVPSIDPFLVGCTDAAGIEMVAPQVEREPGSDIFLVAAGYPTVSRIELRGDGAVAWAQSPPVLS